MKIKTFTLLFTLLALAVLVTPVNAQQPAQEKIPEELTYVDAQVDVLLPKLDSFEREYFDMNKRYYQALTSHEKVPEVPTVPDKLSASPTDQVETLAYFWIAKAFLPETLSWAMSIDTYSGPDGDGYVLNVETMLYKQIWQRSINYGPEEYRSTDWYQMIPVGY